MIANFPKHPRVRELALHQINNRGGDISVVAHVYKDDKEIRRQLIKQINPLPAHLRLQIVDRLSRQTTKDDFAIQLLSEYDEDEDIEVKTTAAIAYAKHVKDCGEDQIPLIEKLSDGLHAGGPDLSERRQAAFAGLLELDRLDIISEANQIEPQILRNMDFGGVLKMNLRLASHLARYWERVYEAFGSGFWEEIGYIPDEFLKVFVEQIKDADIVEKVIDKMEKNKGVSLSVAALRIRSRQWRGTEQLRKICLDRVVNFYLRDWNNAAPCIISAEILSEQFVGDNRTKQELETAADNVPNATALIIALCKGWPDSPILERFLDKQRQKKLLLPAMAHLASRFTSPKNLIDWLGRFLPKFNGNIWEFLPTCSRAFLDRFERDTQVREEAFKRLEKNANAAEKVNLSLLLRQTDTHVNRLREWCQKEIHSQLHQKQFPEFAIDIFSGNMRPVGHVLNELLIM